MFAVVAILKYKAMRCFRKLLERLQTGTHTCTYKVSERLCCRSIV